MFKSFGFAEELPTDVLKLQCSSVWLKGKHNYYLRISAYRNTLLKQLSFKTLSSLLILLHNANFIFVPCLYIYIYIYIYVYIHLSETERLILYKCNYPLSANVANSSYIQSRTENIGYSISLYSANGEDLLFHWQQYIHLLWAIHCQVLFTYLSA